MNIWRRIQPSWLPILVFCTFPLSAQVAKNSGTEVRRWVTGTVHRADGEPWKGATVTLFSQPWGLIPNRGFDDRVTATSDDRGNFKARVLPARTYSAWALSPVVDGQYTATMVAQGVSAGVPVALRENSSPLVQVQVELRGLAAWQAAGKLRYEVMVMLDNHLVLPCRVEDGRVILPPSPKRSVFFRVRTPSMLPIGSGSIPLSRAYRQKQLRKEATSDPNDKITRTKARFTTISLRRTTCELLPPARLRVRITGENGPLAGARLFTRDRAEMYPVVKTGADGIAELLLPQTAGTKAQPSADYLSFWVDGPKHILGHYYAWKVPLASGAVDVELGLYRGSSIRGRVLWRPGHVAARVPILLHSSIPNSQGGGFTRNGGSNSGSPTIYWTDDDGRFEIPGRPGHLSWQLTTFVCGENAKSLPRSRVYPLFPRMVLASGWDQPRKDVDLGTMTLSAYRPLDIEVLDAEGRPAASASLRFRESPERKVSGGAERVGFARTNWAGQVRILCRPGATMLVRLGSKSSAPEHEIPIGKDVPAKLRLHQTPSK